MNVEIREYSKMDYLNLMTISDDEWAETIKVTGFSLLKSYDGEVIKVLLAICSGEIAGFIYGFVLPNQTLIPEFMYIKPDYRHQGIAPKLLSELEKQSGCVNSMIFYNKTLRGYYQRQGYQSGENLEVAMKEL